MADEAYTVKRDDLAGALGISRRQGRRLEDEGIFTRADKFSMYLQESLRNWARQESSLDFVDIEEEKLLHETARRQMMELQVARARQVVLDIQQVQLAALEGVTMFRTLVSGWPSKLAPSLVGRSADDIRQLLQAELAEALEVLPAFSLDMFSKGGIQPAADDDIGRDV